MNFSEFTKTPPRPDPADVGRVRYVKSYLLIRLIIGLLGLSLPFLMVLGSLLLREDEPLKTSISAYYHHGMGDFFVGALCAAALFLLSYMAFERNFDNWVSMAAGGAALGVAFLPTGGNANLTPLQARIGEGVVSGLHFTFALVFILALAGICWRFGRGEARRPDRNDVQRRRGAVLHYGCAGAIVVAVLYIVVAKASALSGPLGTHALFIGETMAVIAFGASWTVKGTELALLGRATRDDARVAAAIEASETITAEGEATATRRS